MRATKNPNPTTDPFPTSLEVPKEYLGIGARACSVEKLTSTLFTCSNDITAQKKPPFFSAFFGFLLPNIKILSRFTFSERKPLHLEPNKQLQLIRHLFDIKIKGTSGCCSGLRRSRQTLRPLKTGDAVSGPFQNTPRKKERISKVAVN